MKVIEKTEPLSSLDNIYNKLKIAQGVVMDFAVVQTSYIGGQWHQVVRYDCSHGQAHKDCLYEKNNRKEALLNRPLDELYSMAKDEIRANWGYWRSLYTKNLSR